MSSKIRLPRTGLPVTVKKTASELFEQFTLTKTTSNPYGDERKLKKLISYIRSFRLPWKKFGLSYSHVQESEFHFKLKPSLRQKNQTKRKLNVPKLKFNRARSRNNYRHAA